MSSKWKKKQNINETSPNYNIFMMAAVLYNDLRTHAHIH